MITEFIVLLALQFDLPANGARQTGSAFKTFVLTDAVWLHHADPNRTWYDSSKFTYRPTPQSRPWTPRTYENRYFGPEVAREAREIFPETIVPRDFDVVEIPFPERGPPKLVKGGVLAGRADEP